MSPSSSVTERGSKLMMDPLSWKAYTCVATPVFGLVTTTAATHKRMCLGDKRVVVSCFCTQFTLDTFSMSESAAVVTAAEYVLDTALFPQEVAGP